MLSSSTIRVSNSQRLAKRNGKKVIRQEYVTPPKSQINKYIWAKVDNTCEKYGYDCKPGQSKVLKYMNEEFEQKAWKYFKNQIKPKILKNKDKYELNMKLGKLMKKNPLVKIFNRVENKIQIGDKVVAFQAIRRCAF